jgi:site-specific DNA recombinase
VSRQNPPDAWIVEQVPDLRIIDDVLWEAVKGNRPLEAACPFGP